MNYQSIILVGNATRDAEIKTSKKGNVTYTTFGVAVSAGKDRTTFFPVTVFGKYGEAVAKYVTKGRQILVSGRIAAAKNRFNVVADTIQLGTSGGGSTQ